MDTIVALATPLQAHGAVGIVRLSGEDALVTAQKIFCPFGKKQPDAAPGTMFLGTVSAGKLKDKAFCVYHKAPKSYTGEDVVELQFHGGRAVAKHILTALTEAGARPAEAGEFTKRAFLNGKMTLAEAEGVADIINAESEAAARQAYRMLSGELSKEIAACEALLLAAAANVEAVLDYPEELTDDLSAPTRTLLETVKTRLDILLNGAADRRYVTDGVSVAIAGLTNVGKSSLLNALIKDDRAIVTDIAGTTRDVMRESFELDGIRMHLLDTAGIRESADTVEAIGVTRAKKAVEGADLVLFVMDLSVPEEETERALRAEMQAEKTIFVANKGDAARYAREAAVVIEAKTGKNLAELTRLMAEKLKLSALTSGVTLTRERHIFAVREARDAVEQALSGYEVTTADCLAVDIKSAYRALTAITGEDASEAIVDKIFSEFCVGK